MGIVARVVCTNTEWTILYRRQAIHTNGYIKKHIPVLIVYVYIRSTGIHTYRCIHALFSSITSSPASRFFSHDVRQPRRVPDCSAAVLLYCCSVKSPNNSRRKTILSPKIIYIPGLYIYFKYRLELFLFLLFEATDQSVHATPCLVRQQGYLAGWSFAGSKPPASCDPQPKRRYVQIYSMVVVGVFSFLARFE